MSVYQKPSTTFEVCRTESGDYYIRNEVAIREVVLNVRAGRYCTILGTSYCQKSLLLRDVKTRLESTGDEVCILLDLQEFVDTTDNDFLPNFAAMVDRDVKTRHEIAYAPSLTEVKDEPSLQRFFQDYVQKLERDLVLLIDHLERVRIGPLQSLLRTLRAVYDGRSSDTPYRLGIVTASSLNVAAVALDLASPSNLAHLVWIQDLSQEESVRLIQCILEQQGVEITSGGLDRMFDATNGDRYLLQEICKYCCNLAVERQKGRITKREVSEAVDRIAAERAKDYQQLRETIRTLEYDPITLMNTLKILEHGSVPRRELRMGFEPDIDKLQLTGACRVEGRSEKIYYIRNEIYDRCLKEHFSPGRVVRVLNMAGQWEEAIGYLQRVVTDNPKYRSLLLGTILESIYAARSESEASKPLAQRLSQAFAIPKVCIYIAAPDQAPEQARLALVSQVGCAGKSVRYIPLEELGRPEIRTYFSQQYEVSQNAAGEQALLIPIPWDEWQSLGLAVIYGFKADPLAKDFQELLAFLQQVGRALGHVISLTSLYEMGKQVTNSLDLEMIMKTTVTVAIRSVPGAQRGSLLLWDEEKQKLIVQTQTGYRKEFADKIQMGRGEGYVGIVYANGEPIRMGNVLADPRTLLRDDPDIKKQKSAICVPLKALGRVIGVLCLDNIKTYDAFRERDLELLSAFADQAAIAIQNARLHTELYELGLRINRGDISPQEIFQQTVQSITLVSDAKAANMLLWRSADNTQLSMPKEVILRASYGLGSDFDDKIRPRPNGLTACVLKARRPLAVSNPDESPGIHPLALERGIKSYLGLPMMIQDAIIGVLFVHHGKPHVFSENEIAMLSLFANQAAIAIENKRLLDQLQNQFSHLAHARHTQLESFHEVGQELKRVLLEAPEEVSKLLEMIAKAAKRVLEADLITLYQYYEQDSRFDMPPTQSGRFNHPEWLIASIRPGSAPDQIIKMREAHYSETALTDRVMRAEEVVPAGDGLPPRPSFVDREAVVSSAGIPLQAGQEIVGVMFINYCTPHPFSEDEKHVIETFAAYAALAIQGARRFGEAMQLRKQEALEQTSRMVAHRLRNVLPVISGRIERILTRGMVTGEGIQWACVALEQTRRAQRIVKDFETFSCRGVFERPDLLSGAELVKKLGKVVKENLAQTGVQAQVSVRPNLPSVQINLDRLSDDFANFVHDSERHKPGGLCITIAGELADEADLQRVGPHSGSTYLKLIYSDNGPGIPSGLKQRIFESFYTTTGGSGLGLAIAMHNAKVHGGALIECGQLGNGVRFEIYLPAVYPVQKGG